jgi:hypothetical protein
MIFFLGGGGEGCLSSHKTPSVLQTLPDWKVPILDLGSNTLNMMIIIQESLVPSYRPHQTMRPILDICIIPHQMINYPVLMSDLMEVSFKIAMLIFLRKFFLTCLKFKEIIQPLCLIIQKILKLSCI